MSHEPREEGLETQMQDRSGRASRHSTIRACPAVLCKAGAETGETLSVGVSDLPRCPGNINAGRVREGFQEFNNQGLSSLAQYCRCRDGTNTLRRCHRHSTGLLGFALSPVSLGLGLLPPPHHGQLHMDSNQLQEGTASLSRPCPCAGASQRLLRYEAYRDTLCPPQGHPDV